jgi:protocatechuate 3,4-dioxygenase beta subunit
MKSSSRRAILRSLGGFGTLALFGCGSGASSATEPSTGSTSPDAGTAGGDGSISAGGFAVGSGAFLADKDYGNPFQGGLGAACTAYMSSTKGPCHSNTYLRKDVTDGLIGLPTRFEFLVVDTACNPVKNAFVEIWYASPAGTYSKAAEVIDSGTGYGGSGADLSTAFCTGNNAEALASKWLRGFQISGADGRVTIDGIFPGWYASRTTHVHFIITASGHSSATSQLFFDEALTTAVYTQHGAYSARGNKDTTNASDNVARGLTLSTVLMTVSQQSDGALLASKTLTIA